MVTQGILAMVVVLLALVGGGCGEDEEPRRDAAIDARTPDSRSTDGGADGDDRRDRGPGDLSADDATPPDGVNDLPPVDDGGDRDGPRSDAPPRDDAGNTDALALDLLGPDLGPCGGCPANQTCLGKACSCVLAVFGNHALRVDGTVIDYGASPPALITRGSASQPLDQVTQIYTGQHHGCARRSDGTVWCWPLSTSQGNSAGQLGNGSLGGSLVLRRATQVLREPTGGTPAPLSNIVAISGGASRCYLASNTCAVRGDGTLWCWGANDASGGGGGQLFNDGKTGNRPYATQILAATATPLTGVDAVTVGARHACVLRSGDVWCWGGNVAGALGLGDQTSRSYPVKVTLPAKAQQIGAGFDFSCARVGAGVYCWGLSGGGQLGIGSPAANTDGCINFCKLTPEPVLTAAATPLAGVAELDVFYQGACVRRSDDTLWCWGQGTGTFAQPLSLGGSAVNEVVDFSSCSSANLPAAIRTLDQSNNLKRSQQTLTQTCN